MTKRASDQGRVAALWGRYGRDLTTVAAVLLAAWAVIGLQTNIADLRDEQAARINETCRISETKQKNDVDALIRTYEYLGNLRAAEFAQPLNKAVLAGLPRTIRDAQTDDAPRYCDKPGVGLPEPDPPRPCPPKGERPKGCIAPPENLPPA